MMKPKIAESQIQVNADFESDRAPAKSPAWILGFTRAAYTIATIPKGKQQHSVTTIAWIR